MDLLAKLGRRLRRWDVLLPAAGVVFPAAALAVLGAVWVFQNDAWLLFIGGALALNLVLWGLRVLLRRAAARSSGAEAEATAHAEDTAAQPHVPADPDWSPADTAAFSAAQALVAQRVTEPLDWPVFQSVAREVVEEVAHAAPGGKTALDFTVPEALLLVERVAARFRADLRDTVPFSDRVTLAHGAWIWRNRQKLKRAQDVIGMARHGVRIATDLPSGLAALLNSLLGGRSQSYLSAEGLAALQRVLLEEIARVAIDLYSGRLRFSDAELLEIQIAATGEDRARLATPDAPLRLVLVGQVSAGKSSLVSALAGSDLAEADAAPTTEAGTVYPMEVDGLPCHVVDTPGIDGTTVTDDALVGEMLGADAILVVIRADRPGRAPDLQLRNALSARLAAEPERRPAPVIAVVSGIDLLTDGWPHTEHQLSAEAQARVAAICAAVEDELDLPEPIPVSLVEPEWNIDRVRAAILAAAPEALAVQRNRARLAARRGVFGATLAEAGRTGRGLAAGGRRLGRDLLRRRGLSD